MIDYMFYYIMVKGEHATQGSVVSGQLSGVRVIISDFNIRIITSYIDFLVYGLLLVVRG